MADGAASAISGKVNALVEEIVGREVAAAERAWERAQLPTRNFHTQLQSLLLRCSRGCQH